MPTPLTRLRDQFAPIESDEKDLAHAFNRVSRGIGWCAIGLPLVCWLGACLPYIPPIKVQNSLSHFFFIPFFGAAFVGGLFFIGILLVFYFHDGGKPIPGWRNVRYWESLTIRCAGLLAMGIATFPATGPGAAYETTESTHYFETASDTAVNYTAPLWSFIHWNDAPIALFGFVLSIHFICAVCMFGILAYFTACVFTRDQTGKALKPDAFETPKKHRNRLYRSCAAIIIGCILLIALGTSGLLIPQDTFDHVNAVFYLEWLAMAAFGVAWLGKGKQFTALNDRNSII